MLSVAAQCQEMINSPLNDREREQNSKYAPSVAHLRVVYSLKTSSNTSSFSKPPPNTAPPPTYRPTSQPLNADDESHKASAAKQPTAAQCENSTFSTI
ncbi:unnamed protein product [Ceratitis capitata]|uniref:(Mediterranean fruit fly) hypothetical protein n=1 Tax=Ceratitis capitata TaxID=7213 RepID=A0A811VJT0_CERCA|nr:unnamed protein product [Ceratitis capitata]